MPPVIVVAGLLDRVDATGANALGNAVNGLSLDSAGRTLIGGTVAGARQHPLRQLDYAIEIFGLNSTSNLVQGNYIGPSVTGSGPPWPTVSAALHVVSAGNTVGGAVAGAGNVISGNGRTVSSWTERRTRLSRGIS